MKGGNQNRYWRGSVFTADCMMWVCVLYMHLCVWQKEGCALKPNLQHADRQTNTHTHAHARMYSLQAPHPSLAEWQHDYCMQSLHYSTALGGKRREMRRNRTKEIQRKRRIGCLCRLKRPFALQKQKHKWEGSHYKGEQTMIKIEYRPKDNQYFSHITIHTFIRVRKVWYEICQSGSVIFN